MANNGSSMIYRVADLRGERIHYGPLLLLGVYMFVVARNSISIANIVTMGREEALLDPDTPTITMQSHGFNSTLGRFVYAYGEYTLP